MKNQSKNHASVGVVAGKEAYEGKAALEALDRVGKNINIKGVVHEVMFKDKLNIGNIFSGKTASLTSAANAVRDDIILKSSTGGVVGRMQLKDTVTSIKNTVSRVSNGQYARTLLMGTKETTQSYTNEVARQASKGATITQKMSSTGISSADTARIGAKAIGIVPSTEAIAAGFKSAGKLGGAISGGIEAVTSLGDFVDGKISGGEYVGRVAKETIGGGLSAGVATTASSFAVAGTSTVMGATGIASAISGTAMGATIAAATPIAIGITIAVGTGYIFKSAYDSIFG